MQNLMLNHKYLQDNLLPRIFKDSKIMNRSNNVVIVTWIHFFFSLKSAWPVERPLGTTAANENVFFFHQKITEAQRRMLHRILTQILPHVSGIRFVFIILPPDAYRFTYHLTSGMNKHCAHLSHPPFKKPLNSP